MAAAEEEFSTEDIKILDEILLEFKQHFRRMEHLMERNKISVKETEQSYTNFAANGEKNSRMEAYESDILESVDQETAEDLQKTIVDKCDEVLNSFEPDEIEAADSESDDPKFTIPEIADLDDAEEIPNADLESSSLGLIDQLIKENKEEHQEKRETLEVTDIVDIHVPEQGKEDNGMCDSLFCCNFGEQIVPTV